MAKKRKPTARQIEVNRVYHQLKCNVRATARQLNISRPGVRKTLLGGAINGLPVAPDRSSPVAPAGWSSTFKTVQYNKKGIVQVWDRVKPDELDLDGLFAFLKSHTPVLARDIPSPKNPHRRLMLEWLLMDHHLGMHAWAKETGADYDTKIARDLIERAAGKIFSQHGMVDTAVIVLGGDNLHTDTRSNVTEKSKHHLDVDSRYPKNMAAIYSGMVTAIDTALLNAKNVQVVVLSGNHDYHSSICLAIILQAHYRKIDRVTIDTSPAKHKFFKWGNNFFMYTHGDTGNDKRLSSYAMNHVIKNNIVNVERIYVRKAHLHKSGRVTPPGLIEEDGVIIEHFRTLMAPDSFAHEQAYSQVRATVANVWHTQYGQRSRMELGIAELMAD